jgi:excisionase family DNA binding protein
MCHTVSRSEAEATVGAKHELLTPTEVMGWLQISRRTLARLVGNGSLPAVRVGGQLRFQPDAVEAFIEANRHRGLDVSDARTASDDDGPEG